MPLQSLAWELCASLVVRNAKHVFVKAKSEDLFLTQMSVVSKTNFLDSSQFLFCLEVMPDQLMFVKSLNC